MREMTGIVCNVKRRIFTLTILCVTVAALGGCSAQQVTNAQSEKGGAATSTTSAGAPAPQAANVDRFLESLRDIVEHGDLADIRYYGEKLGVTMQESASGRIIVPRMCGLSRPVPFREISGQLFYYSSVPDYFDKNWGMRGCQEPYRKEFLPDGLVRVAAEMHLDTKKMCIFKEDVHRYFSTNGNYVGKYYEMKNVFYGKNQIIILVIFDSNSDGCARIVVFGQNQEQGK